MTKNIKGVIGDINVYFIENNTSKLAQQGKGGQFYNVYSNEGPILKMENFMDVTNDLSEIEEAAVLVDPTFKRIGGTITPRNKSIKTLTVFEISGDKVALQSQEASRLMVLAIEKIKLSNKRAELLQQLRLTDIGLKALENEEKSLEEKSSEEKSLVK
jgi:hypothetical protein